MIKIMKGNLARQMFLVHPELKKELWGGHLWNPSYCAVTVSDRSRDQVLTYIATGAGIRFLPILRDRRKKKREG